MSEPLRIVEYPDPRLKKRSIAVPPLGPELRALAEQMFVLMRDAQGVGLAAPQVGKNLRLFVMNATGKPEDDRVYLNPQLSDLDGDEEGEEGCLSIPELRVKVVRAKHARIEALDLDGNKIDQSADGFVTRIWQHETDHLDGVLLTDRMGSVAKIANRGLLKDLEEKYKRALGG